MKNKNFFVRGICGFCIGFAFIIPGFSGSAIAMMFGLYEEMLDSVNNIFKQFKKSFTFLLPIAIGVVASIILLYFPLMWALEKNCFVVIMLFAGLLIGGLKPMLKMTQWKTISFKRVLVFLFCFIKTILNDCHVDRNNFQTEFLH